MSGARNVTFSTFKFNFEGYVKRATDWKVKGDFRIRSSLLYGIQGGQKVLTYFKGSRDCLENLYPHFKIEDNERASRNFWKENSNELFFMEALSQKIPQKIQRLADWREMDNSILIAHHGTSLLFNNSSLLHILERNFPSFFWQKSWKFPDIYSLEKKRIFVDGFILSWIEFVCMQKDLYEVRYTHFLHVPEGYTLLNMNGSSPQFIFQQVYPEFITKYGLNGFQGEERLFIDRFLLHLGYVETQEDLNLIPTKTFSEYPGGSSVLLLYNGSFQTYLNKTYKELNTTSVERRAYRGYWQNELMSQFLHKIMCIYHLQCREDWYRISVEQLSRVYGKRLMNKKHIINLLKFWQPEENWEHERFSEKMNRRSRQKFLGLKLKELLENEVIFEDFVFKTEDKVFVFDFYLPGLNLVIEYQGEQHYFSILKWLTLETQRKRDDEKELFCSQNNLKLLYVPFWWDNSLHTLNLILSSKTFPPIAIPQTI